MRIYKHNEFEKIMEDSATGGPAVTGGMGAVVSAQPSGIPGLTIGPNWASNGGTEGSGDVSVPYNPSGGNRVFHKVEIGTKRTTGDPYDSKKKKKSSFKKLSQLKSQLKKKKPEKVMNFDDYLKKDFEVVKKNEGVLDQLTYYPYQFQPDTTSLNMKEHNRLMADLKEMGAMDLIKYIQYAYRRRNDKEYGDIYKGIHTKLLNDNLEKIDFARREYELRASLKSDDILELGNYKILMDFYNQNKSKFPKWAYENKEYFENLKNRTILSGKLN